MLTKSSLSLKSILATLLMLLPCVEVGAWQQQKDFVFAVSEDTRSGWHTLPPGLPESIIEERLTEKVQDKNIVYVGAFNFGAARSTSVAIAIARKEIDKSKNPANESDEYILWVDQNRSGQFDDSECVGSSRQQGVLPLWILDLQADYVTTDTSQSTQSQNPTFKISIKYDTQRGQIAIRTAGRMEGRATFGDKQLLAQIEDRNANGRWFDLEDRIFVDLNNDGKLNRLLERIPAQGLKRIRGQLLAIEGNTKGTRLTLRPVTDQGWLVPSLTLAEPETEVVNFTAILASQSGMQVKLTEHKQPVQVPIGKYFVRELDITLHRKEAHYRFKFSNLSKNGMVEIQADQRRDIPLLGSLRLEASLASSKSRNEIQLVTSPILKSQSGLYLLLAESGSSEAMSENRLHCANISIPTKLLGVGSSGFS
ncbi:MAG: hypothetical protein AAF483_08345 [Planctomycetota bacterium]